MLSSKSLRAQVVYKNVESSNARHTFERLRTFLKKHQGPGSGIFDMNEIGFDSQIYDTILSNYFDRQLLIAIAEKEKLDFSTLLARQRQILFQIDRVLEHIPADSIFVVDFFEYFRHAEDDPGVDSAKAVNHFIAGFLINNEMFPLVDIQLNSSQDAFASFYPVIYFNDRGVIVRQFLERYGYKQFEK